MATSATKKKTARKTAAKKATAKKKTKTMSRKKGPVRKPARRRSSGAKRRPNAAFMKPMQPSKQLAAVVGSKPLPRTEIVKKVWGYIKQHGLQDKRNINADERLGQVFGGKRTVNMFEMMSLVNKHLS
jgi:upstream activation factor subunit UAF30